MNFIHRISKRSPPPTPPILFYLSLIIHQLKEAYDHWPHSSVLVCLSQSLKVWSLPTLLQVFLVIIKLYKAMCKDVILQVRTLLTLKASSYSWLEKRTGLLVELCCLEFHEAVHIQDAAAIFLSILTFGLRPHSHAQIHSLGADPLLSAMRLHGLPSPILPSQRLVGSGTISVLVHVKK